MSSSRRNFFPPLCAHYLSIIIFITALQFLSTWIPSATAEESTQTTSDLPATVTAFNQRLTTVETEINQMQSKGQDLASNILTDWAAIVALFGDAVISQYVSHTYGYADRFIFAIAPFGILAAISGAIRVSGPLWLKTIIGKAKEPRVDAEKEFTCATGKEISEVWNGRAIERIVGPPQIVELYAHDREVVKKNNGSDLEYLTSIGPWQSGKAKKENTDHETDKFQSQLVPGNSSPEASHSLAEKGELLVKAGSLDELPSPTVSPNLSLNARADPVSPRMKWILALLAIGLQLGVLAYATLSQYGFNKILSKDSSIYILPMFSVGVFSLTVGMWLCSYSIESATTRTELRHKCENVRFRFIWIQKGTKAGLDDQSQKSYIIFSEPRHTIITVEPKEEIELWIYTCVFLGLVLTSAGWALQVISLRALHWSVTVTQFGLVIIMAAIRAYVKKGLSREFIVKELPEGFEMEWLALRADRLWEIAYAESENMKKKSFLYRIWKYLPGVKVAPTLGPSQPTSSGTGISNSSNASLIPRNFFLPISCVINIGNLVQPLSDLPGASGPPTTTSSPRPNEQHSSEAFVKPRRPSRMKTSSFGADILPYAVSANAPETSDATEFTPAQQLTILENEAIDIDKPPSITYMIALQNEPRRVNMLPSCASEEAVSISLSIGLIMDNLSHLMIPPKSSKAKFKKYAWYLDIQVPSYSNKLKRMAVEMTVEKEHDRWKGNTVELDSLLSLWLMSLNNMENMKLNKSEHESASTLRNSKSQVPNSQIGLRRRQKTNNEGREPGGKDRTRDSHVEPSIRLIGPNTTNTRRDYYWWFTSPITQILGVQEDGTESQSPWPSRNYRVWDELDNGPKDPKQQAESNKKFRCTRIMGFHDFKIQEEWKEQRHSGNGPYLAVETFAPLRRLCAQEILTRFMMAVAHQISIREKVETTNDSSSPATMVLQSTPALPSSPGPGNMNIGANSQVPTGNSPRLTEGLRIKMEVDSSGEASSAPGESETVVGPIKSSLLPGQDKEPNSPKPQSLENRSRATKPVYKDHRVDGVTQIIQSADGSTDGELAKPGDFKVSNTRLEAIARGIAQTSLATLEEAYTCIIPPLSVKGVLPRVSHILVQRVEEYLAKQNIPFAAPGPNGVQHLQKGAKLYGWLLDKTKSFRWDSPERAASAGMFANFCQIPRKELQWAKDTKEREVKRNKLERLVGYLEERKREIDDNLGEGLAELIEFMEAKKERNSDRPFGANPNDILGYTAAHAKAANDADIMASDGKIDPSLTCPDVLGRTPLHYAAANTVISNNLQLLMNTPTIDINAKDMSNWTPLHYAAWKGNAKALNALLEQNADVESAGRDGMRPMMCAAARGFRDILDKLIDAGAEIEAIDCSQRRPLHWAAYNGDKKTLETLIQRGADLNSKDANGKTSLHIALATGNSAACMALTNAGADVTAKDKDGKTPLDITGAKNTEELKKKLWAGTPEKEKPHPKIHKAIENNDVPTLKQLLANGVNPNEENSKRETPLLVASKRGLPEIVGILLEQRQKSQNSQPTAVNPPLNVRDEPESAMAFGALTSSEPVVDPNALDYNMDSALHHAVRAGNERVAEWLLENRADPNASNLSAETPLHIAVKENHIKLAELLLRMKYKCSINPQDIEKQTPLHITALSRNVEMARHLLCCGAKPGPVDIFGQTPLHIAVEQGDLDMVALLAPCHERENGEGRRMVDVKDNLGHTALHAAAREGKLKVVQALIEKHNANTETVDYKGRTCLHVAAYYGRKDIVSSLLDNGAKRSATDDNLETPLHIASWSGEEGVEGVIEELLRNMTAESDLASRNINGETALHCAVRGWEHAREEQDSLTLAAREWQVGIIQSVKPRAKTRSSHEYAQWKNLNEAVDNFKQQLIRFSDKQGPTEKGDGQKMERQRRVVKLLLDKGSNKEALNKDSCTPLHIAARYADRNIVNFLVMRGAQTNATDKGNQTPLHLAARWGKYSVVERLLAADERRQPNAECEGKDERGSLTPERKCNTKDKEGNTPLHAACIRGDRHITELLLQSAGINNLNMKKCTPLHLAARYSNYDTAELLLARGAIPTLKDDEGNTPLHIACRWGNNNIINLLLRPRNSLVDSKSDVKELEVEIDSKNKKGETPLHLAALRGNELAIKILVENGANVYATTTSYRTPFDVAIREHQLSATPLLGKLGRELPEEEYINANEDSEQFQMEGGVGES